MKLKSIIAFGCLAVLTFSSCSKDDNTPVNPQNVNSKRLTLNASPRDSWLYVNLETGDTVTAKDVNEWEYHEFIIENGKYKKKPDGTLDYKVIKTIPAGKPNAPKTWHLAVHVYDALINNGEALMTNETELSKLTEMPKGNYVANKQLFIPVDMSGMQNSVMGYSKGYSNLELNKWISSKGMPPKYTMSDKVFSVRFKDGSYALIKFKDYADKKGKKKLVDFEYKFVKK